MAMKYEVTAVTGKYTTQDGTEKNRYLKIGAVIETRNGLSLKLESVPVGWDGWAYLNEPRERDAKQRQDKPQRQAPERDASHGDAPDGGFTDDEIPFRQFHHHSYF